MAEFDVTGRIDSDSIDWESGSCFADVDPNFDIWFERHPGEAIRVCGTCPIIADCRTYAIDHGQSYGVWGGMSEAELRREIKAAEDKPQICTECAELFNNRFQSDFCGPDCRQAATRRSKRVAKHRPALPQAHYIDRRTA